MSHFLVFSWRRGRMSHYVRRRQCGPVEKFKTAPGKGHDALPGSAFAPWRVRVHFLAAWVYESLSTP